MIFIKTKEQIFAESLIQLLGEQDMENANIGDIIQNCNLSRRTFYNHFDDKTALVKWIFAHDDEFSDHLAWYQHATYREAVLNKLQIIYDNRVFYSKILSNRVYAELFKEEVKQRILACLKAYQALDPKLEFIADFIAYGSTAKIQQWADSEMPQIPAGFMEALKECIPADLKKIMKTKKGKKISSLNSSDPKGYFNVPKEA